MNEEIEQLLRPYVLQNTILPDGVYGQFARYLQLLLKWNARTNLTAIHDPEEMVRRHFGESLFAAQYVVPCETLLDFGSGAGFPGLPIQFFHPKIAVTLAESQNKKATFLREVVRTLNLKTNVWAGRVEAMPESLRFDVVALRAVDNMDAAMQIASQRTTRQMLLLTTSSYPLPAFAGFVRESAVPIPDSNLQQIVSFIRRTE